MDVFEFAMQMEKDGEKYYRKMAGQAENAVMKNILLELADDEVKHYNIFRQFKDGDFSAVGEITAPRTTVLQNARNVFQQLSDKHQDLAFAVDVVSTWREAQKVEKKSEDFYREKADMESDADVKRTLHIIADEEHKHWVLIENVLQFLDRPRQWLEDAEWNNLDQY
ncbi:MAG: ferritin family protein [Candidatus Zixiibacteriota bacterium]|nr:MAG: ferritin family protein [candidate division Zixibacteria bacterium]